MSDLAVSKLQELCKISPSWAKRLTCFGGLLNYASTLTSTDPGKAKIINTNLNEYINELHKTTDTLRYYTTEQKSVSRLYAEVNLGFLAVEKWVKNIEQKKEPRELAESLPRKSGRLRTAIALESVANLNQAAKELEEALVEEALKKGESKHPLVYYKQGREHVYKMQWYEAKQCFLNYETLVLAGGSGCKNPHTDNFYFYLSYIQAQMDAQSKASVDLICTVIESRDNKYEEKYQAWLKKYPPLPEDLLTSSVTPLRSSIPTTPSSPSKTSFASSSSTSSTSSSTPKPPPGPRPLKSPSTPSSRLPSSSSSQSPITTPTKR